MCQNFVIFIIRLAKGRTTFCRSTFGLSGASQFGVTRSCLNSDLVQFSYALVGLLALKSFMLEMYRSSTQIMFASACIPRRYVGANVMKDCFSFNYVKTNITDHILSKLENRAACQIRAAPWDFQWDRPHMEHHTHSVIYASYLGFALQCHLIAFGENNLQPNWMLSLFWH